MTTSTSEMVSKAPIPDFPVLAAQSLSNLRSAIIGMFSEVPGGVRKSYDVNKILGVDARLSWQIFKLTGPGDALTLASHVPAPATMRRLLATASTFGIKPEYVEQARRAFDAFEDFVEKHAGDRSTFETMLRGLAFDEASEQADITDRKAIFKGYRNYLGVEVETFITAMFNHPAAQPGFVDIGSIRGKLGMRRLRSDGELMVDNVRVWNTGSGEKTFCRDAFDPVAAEKYGAALIPEFCTRPLPALKFKDGPNGQRATTLAGRTVGRQGQADLVFGNVWRDVMLLTPDQQGVPGFGFNAYHNCPTTHLYFDVLVPKPIFGSLEPSLEIYGFAPVLGDIDEIKRTQPLLPFREKIVRLAGGLEAARIREVPQYLDMLKTFCQKLQWREDDFDIFRLYLEYPIVGSMISLRFNQVGQ